MVGACNLLGVDVMTGHWEFTYRDEEVLDNIAAFNGEFVAQNVRVTEDALFEGAAAFDEDSGHAFKPWTLREVGGRRIAVIGQAFPVHPDRQSLAVHSGLDLRHPRSRTAGTGRQHPRQPRRHTPSCCSRTTAWTWT